VRLQQAPEAKDRGLARRSGSVQIHSPPSPAARSSLFNNRLANLCRGSLK
jgi:hypothetical protein